MYIPGSSTGDERLRCAHNSPESLTCGLLQHLLLDNRALVPTRYKIPAAYYMHDSVHRQ